MMTHPYGMSDATVRVLDRAEAILRPHCGLTPPVASGTASAVKHMASWVQSASLVWCVAATVLSACGGAKTTASSTCSRDELAACVSVERYEADLTTIAQARPSGSPHWQAVQDLCASRFAELGYSVELHKYATGVNVIGQRGTTGGKHVLVSAHYDSVANCAGADDNATGVAALLEVARVLSLAEQNGLVTVACWDEEERGMLGSAAYAERAKAEGTPISVAVVFEMLGYRSSAANSQTLPDGFGLLFPEAAKQVEANQNRADFIALIADESAAQMADRYASRAASIDLNALVAKVPDSMKQSSALDALRRSDHASFWKTDYSALMLTDTAEFRNPLYHCTGGADSPSQLDHGFATKIARATVDSVISELNAP